VRQSRLISFLLVDSYPNYETLSVAVPSLEVFSAATWLLVTNAALPLDDPSEVSPGLLTFLDSRSLTPELVTDWLDTFLFESGVFKRAYVISSALLSIWG